jgi:hypothetical protein
MPHFVLVATIMSGLICSHALAGDPTLIGTWSGDYKTDEGFDREADLVVANGGAMWTGRPKGSGGRHNPCFNRAFPVLIESGSSAALSLWIKASSATPVCKDMRLQLNRVSPTRLEGQFKSGAPVWLEKRQNQQEDRQE